MLHNNLVAKIFKRRRMDTSADTLEKYQGKFTPGKFTNIIRTTDRNRLLTSTGFLTSSQHKERVKIKKALK